MAEGKLSQAEIDALLASMSGDDADSPAAESSDERLFDFRRPNKFGPSHTRSLRSAHEVFARRAAGLLTQSLRSVVTIEHVADDQITYEDYTRSVPNPSVLCPFSVDPLPGPVVVELSAQIGLTLLDRLLGGLGTPVPLRRPTELESSLLQELMQLIGQGLDDAFEPIEAVQAVPGPIDFNPQFLQVVAPSEMVLMFTFQLAMQSTVRSEGLMTICYPFSTLAPAMTKLESGALSQPALGRGEEQRPDEQPLAELLPDVEVPLRIRLNDSTIPARDIVGMRPGDVLRLEHRVDEPAIAEVGDHPVGRGRIGRRGRRLAIQIADWSTT